MDHVGDILGGTEVVRRNGGRRAEIGAGDIDAATAGRARRLEAQQAPRKRIDVDTSARRVAGPIGDRAEVQLLVRPRAAGPGADEAAELVDRQAERAAARGQVANPGQQLGPDGVQLVVQRRPGRLVVVADREMILQVGADRRVVEHDRDAEFAEQRRRPDSGQLQDLGRIHRAATQDDLAGRRRDARHAALDVLDPDRALAIHADPPHPRAGFHTQVRPAERRAQEGVRRGPAPALADRDPVTAQAFRLRPVEIVGVRQAEFLRRRHPGRLGRMQKGAHILDVERPVAQGPSFRVDAPLVLLEVGAHVVPAPAGVAHVAPVVEIDRHAAAVDQRVDRARTADDPAARPVHRAPAEFRIRPGLVLPVHCRIGERAAVADRRADPEGPVGATRLEDEYPVAPAGGEPVGQHAAGGARADDDEINTFHGGAA